MEPLFYVYRFSDGMEDYEVVGAFSKRDEADALAATMEPKGIILKNTWSEVIHQALHARLGRMADVLEGIEPERTRKLWGKNSFPVAIDEVH